MKMQTNVRHYKSHTDYLQNRGSQLGKLNPEDLGNKLKKMSTDDKVQLSEKAKLKDSLKENVKTNAKEIEGASKHLLADAAKVAKGAIEIPGIGTAVEIASSLLPENQVIEEIKEVVSEKDEAGVLTGARVMFVSGLELVGLSSDKEGLPRMANEFEGAEHFSWKDEERILSEIQRTPKNEPVVLVGHSLGGDAVVNIANKLNTFVNGFRKVDLLVTLDSVGFDNDIIPKNVKRNINYIGDKDVFFNDGPNVARDNTKTEVINNLRTESHRELDDSLEIKETIHREITNILSDRETERESMKLMKSFLAKMMEHPNALDILK